MMNEDHFFVILTIIVVISIYYLAIFCFLSKPHDPTDCFNDPSMMSGVSISFTDYVSGKKRDTIRRTIYTGVLQTGSGMCGVLRGPTIVKTLIPVMENNDSGLKGPDLLKEWYSRISFPTKFAVTFFQCFIN